MLAAVTKWAAVLKRMIDAEGCAAYHDEPRSESDLAPIQVDEIWSFSLPETKNAQRLARHVARRRAIRWPKRAA
jgi:hypothetical protein